MLQSGHSRGGQRYAVALFVILARENPRPPPCPPGVEERSLMLDGLKHALTVRFFFVYIMEAMQAKDGEFTPALLLAIGLLIMSALVITQMKYPQ